LFGSDMMTMMICGFRRYGMRMMMGMAGTGKRVFRKVRNFCPIKIFFVVVVGGVHAIIEVIVTI